MYVYVYICMYIYIYMVHHFFSFVGKDPCLTLYCLWVAISFININPNLGLKPLTFKSFISITQPTLPSKFFVTNEEDWATKNLLAQARE